MVGQGEEAYSFLTGEMDEGFEITAGFFNVKARYVAIKRVTRDTALSRIFGNIQSQ